MRRTLLVTNDFPPKVGGIQTYLRDLCALLPSEQLVVLASSYPGDTEFDAALPYRVVRYPTRILLPTPGVFAAIQRLIASENIGTVWFGAAAPLAVLAQPLRRAHPQLKLVASTHGHEVGWSMLPGARQVLGVIGAHCDTITYVSKYARGRVAAALGPHVALESLPGAVDCQIFSPQTPNPQTVVGAASASDTPNSPLHVAAEPAGPTVICVARLVARKGQDMLIDAWPGVLNHFPSAQLQLVGAGPDEHKLRKMVAARGLEPHVTFAGRVSDEELPRLLAAADLFAMPVRTRGYGLDVEGLGIVYLEAQACGTPVLVGDAGGAPETVQDQVTGRVVDGTDSSAIAAALMELLSDRSALAEMGKAGRQWVLDEWNWRSRGAALKRILNMSDARDAALGETSHG